MNICKKRGKIEGSLNSNPTNENIIISTENSFLQEISFNSNIEQDIRNEIDAKFKNSKANANYVFPRFTEAQKKRKRSPVKARISKKTLSFGRSLNNINKGNKSYHDSTCLLEKINRGKIVHRATSSMKSGKENKDKINNPARNTPSRQHNRSASCQKRSKTPCLKKENMKEVTHRKSQDKLKQNRKKNTSEVRMKRPSSALRKVKIFDTIS